MAFSIDCMAAYGLGVTRSTIGFPSARTGARSASAFAPLWHTWIPAMGLPCQTWGRNGAGGASRTMAAAVSSRGADSVRSRYAASTSAARSALQTMRPPVIIGPTSCSRKLNRVTTPKLPPPPRSAQNSSGCWSRLAMRIAPSAVTTSTSARLSTVQPKRRAR